MTAKKTTARKRAAKKAPAKKTAPKEPQTKPESPDENATDAKSEAARSKVLFDQTQALVEVKPDAIDELLKKLREAAFSRVYDPTDAEDRKEMKSVALKISKSKTHILAKLNESIAEHKRIVKETQLAGKRWETECDLMRDEVKKPATEWEEAKAKELDELRAKVERIKLTPSRDAAGELLPSVEIEQAIFELDDMGVTSAEYKEMTALAHQARSEALERLRTDLKLAVAKEQEKAELERLKKEADERDAKSAKEALIAQQLADIAGLGRNLESEGIEELFARLSLLDDIEVSEKLFGDRTQDALDAVELAASRINKRINEENAATKAQERSAGEVDPVELAPAATEEELLEQEEQAQALRESEAIMDANRPQAPTSAEGMTATEVNQRNVTNHSRADIAARAINRALHIGQNSVAGQVVIQAIADGEVPYTTFQRES